MQKTERHTGKQKENTDKWLLYSAEIRFEFEQRCIKSTMHWYNRHLRDIQIVRNLSSNYSLQEQ